MRTISSVLQAHYEKKNTSVAAIVQFQRADGLVTVGATNYGSDVTANFGQGEIVFQSNPGFTVSLLEFLQGLQDQSAQLQTFTTNRVEENPIFNEDQVRARFWRDATFTIGTTNPRARGVTPTILTRGKLGNISLNGIALEMEILGIANALSQPVAHIGTDMCPYVLGGSTPRAKACFTVLEGGPWLASTNVVAKVSGDQRGFSVFRPVNASADAVFNGRQYWCISTGTTGSSPPTFPTTVDTEYSDGTSRFITKMAFTHRGSVISVSGFKVGIGPSIDASAIRFKNGTFLFDTGQLPPAGGFDIDTFDTSTQEFTLKPERALRVFPPKVGDSFRAVFGCNHLFGSTGDCVITFANWLNFGGYGRTPTKVEELEALKNE